MFYDFELGYVVVEAKTKNKKKQQKNKQKKTNKKQKNNKTFVMRKVKAQLITGQYRESSRNFILFARISTIRQLRVDLKLNSGVVLKAIAANPASCTRRVSHIPIPFIISVKASEAVELGFTFPKHYKTFDSPGLYLVFDSGQKY